MHIDDQLLPDTVDISETDNGGLLSDLANDAEKIMQSVKKKSEIFRKVHVLMLLICWLMSQMIELPSNSLHRRIPTKDQVETTPAQSLGQLHKLILSWDYFHLEDKQVGLLNFVSFIRVRTK